MPKSWPSVLWRCSTLEATASAAAVFWRKRRLPRMLSASRFSRRLHAIRHLFLTLFAVMGEAFKTMNPKSIDAIDSFSLACCDNYRIPRSRIYQGKGYRGYKPSKKRYWYNLKFHLMVTQSGAPVEFFVTIQAWWQGGKEKRAKHGTRHREWKSPACERSRYSCEWSKRG